MNEIHTSSISGFNHCPRAWYLVDRDMGLGYRPKLQDVKLQFGTMMHRALELHYLGGMPLKASWASAVQDEILAATNNGQKPLMLEQRAQLNLQAASGLGVIKGYESWIASSGNDPYSDYNLRFLDMERAFVFQPDGCSFKVGGKWDGVVESRSDGETYIFETKTCASVDSTLRGIMWDPQPQLYAWAASNILGKQIQGVVYNLVTSINPFDIPLLKNGLPSKGVKSTVKSTYEVYLMTLLQRAEATGNSVETVLANYAEELAYMRTSSPRLYVRHLHRVSAAMQEQTAKHVTRFSELMDRALNKAADGNYPLPYKSRFTCPNCRVRMVCLAMDEGADWRELLERDFEKVSRREEDEDSDA